MTRQKKIYPETMLMDAGLQEAANWYIEHEGEVNKKPYWKYIDANLV